MTLQSYRFSMILVIMGVTGSGKTTIGKMLSTRLDIPFFDADDFHPLQNVEKMRNGTPLNDEDRKPWLQRLSYLLADEEQKKGAVLACSALKDTYRKSLQENVAQPIFWIHLQGSPALIMERLKNRRGHFMSPTLLNSQFEILEKCEGALEPSIEKDPEIIVEEILNKLN